MPTRTTSVTKHPSLSPTALAQDFEEQDTQSSSDNDYSIYLKVGVPVLSIVLLILAVSGCLVVASSCIFFQSERR
jgi:hypothetical protein